MESIIMMPNTTVFVIVSHVVTKMISDGIVPKLIARQQPFVILTDHAKEHEQSILSLYPQLNGNTVIDCDVFNPISIMNTLHAKQIYPCAIFSNSDHLQTATSIVAAFFKVPHKDWHTTQYCKNKSLMRSKLIDLGLSTIWQYTLTNLQELNTIIHNLQYPLIAKPCMGVASMSVRKINDVDELLKYCNHYFMQSSEQTALLLEKYIKGDVYSLETLGDSHTIRTLGGFKTHISPPPYFIETNASWIPTLDSAIELKLLNILKVLNVQFGACHTEFVIDENDKVEIIEINYRSVGDHKEFLINELYDDQYFDDLIDIYLGEKLKHHQPAFSCAAIDYLVAERDGQIIKVPQNMSQSNLNFTALKTVGESVQRDYSNKDYLGILYALSNQESQLKKMMSNTKALLLWEVINEVDFA